MFREWGFLLTEMIGLIVLAAVLGLFVGWIIWGRQSGVTSEKYAELRTERDTLVEDLAGCKARHQDKDQRISDLQSDLSVALSERDIARIEAADARADSSALRVAQGLPLDGLTPSVRSGTLLPGEDDLDSRRGAWRYEAEDQEGTSGDRDGQEPAGEETFPSEGETQDSADRSDVRDREDEAEAEADFDHQRPEMLQAPRAGGADDLKQISGIGPKLEKLCHSLGIYHFDQIASWTEAEIAWMDANLEGFHGRVTRDNWVAQAQVLAAGGETEFSKRVDRGDIYDT